MPPVMMWDKFTKLPMTTSNISQGSSGAFYSSSPGNSISAMSIASVEKFVPLYLSSAVDLMVYSSVVIPVQRATVGGVQHAPIVYSSLVPLPVNGALKIYATSKDTTIIDDACNALPNSTPNLSSYLVIIRRGTCTFVSQVGGCIAFGN